MSEDKIVIEKCPVCGDAHEYEIVVQRSLTLHLMTTSQSQFPFDDEIKKHTRIFICPNTGIKYKATFEIYSHTLEETEPVETEDPEDNKK